MAQKKNVGLLIFTTIPKMGGVVAILQRRGTFNHERMAPANFPGVCQVTCHGDIESGDAENAEGDGLLKALEREWGEENGKRLSDVAPYFRSEMKPLSRAETPQKLIVTYGLFIENPTFIEHLRLNASSGGIRPITREEVGSILQVEEGLHKTRGVPDQRTIGMFPDAIKAVERGFNIFSPLPLRLVETPQ